MRIFSVIIAILFITGISFPQSNYYVNNMLGEDISSNGNSPRHAFKTIEYALEGKDPTDIIQEVVDEIEVPKDWAQR